MHQSPDLIARTGRNDHLCDASTARLFSHAPWAAALTAEEFAVACSGVQERQFLRGSYICHGGNRLDYWIGVVSGLVKLSTVSRDGRATTLRGVRAGGWFGEDSILKDQPRRYDIVAIQDTHVAMLRKATFDWLHGHSWGFRQFLIRQLNEQLGQLMLSRETDRLSSPAARLAQTLCGLFNPVLFPQADLQIEISQQELAQLSGISRATICKSLKDLELMGVIAASRELITVLDLSRLSDMGARPS